MEKKDCFRLDSQSLHKAILDQEKWVFEVFEHIPIGVFVKNGTGVRTFLFWNQKMEEIFRLSKKEVLGKTTEQVFLDQRDLNAILRMDDLIVKSKRSMVIPFQKIKCKDQEKVVKISKVPVVMPETEEILIIGTVEDITSYKASEQNLIRAHHEREELEQIISLSPVVLFLFRDSPGYPVEFVSKNVWRFGFSNEFFSEQEQSLISFIGQSNEELFQIQIARFSKTVPEVRFEFFSSVKNRWFEAVLWNVDRQSQGSCLVQGVFSDTTEKRTTQEEIADARKSAEEANEAKSRFLATVSHELRTPLNGILGMTNLVLDTTLDSEQKESLNLVKFSAENLLQLINDILDFSKIEAGKLTFEWIPGNLSGLIDKCLSSLQILARKKGIELISEIHPKLDMEYLFDPFRFAQILNNLIGNALKFTEKGHVKLKAMPLEVAPKNAIKALDGKHRKLYDPQNFCVYFRVEDTGIGIPEEKQEQIFSAFLQSDASMSRKYGGTGLGLTISRTLIERFSGEIWVESEQGRGSVFHFFVVFRNLAASGHSGPRSAVESSRIEELAERFLSTPLKLLLAEDNPVNRRVAVKHVEKLGWEIISVENGRQALNILKERTFDAVLMDIQMPIMDGIQALCKIRDHHEFGEVSTIPVIAMTAMSESEKTDEIAMAGFDGFISKPFKIEDLKRTVLMAVLQKEKE